MRAKSLHLCPTLHNTMDCARQAPLSMGFPRQEYWSGLPVLSPYNLFTCREYTFGRGIYQWFPNCAPRHLGISFCFVINFYWSAVALRGCGHFCDTAKWVGHTRTHRCILSLSDCPPLGSPQRSKQRSVRHSRSSVAPFSSCPQSFPAQGLFQWVSSSHQTT